MERAELINAGDSTGNRIMRAALRLFGRKGYGAVGIREIALEAGVSTAALYHYMRTKEDLLVTLMADRLRRITVGVRGAIEEVSAPEQQLVAMVRVHIIAHARFPEGVIDEEVRSLSSETRPTIVALRDAYESVWNDVLRAGQEEGVFDIARPKFARLALLEMCNGVVHWYSPAGDAGLTVIADEYADMALALVRATRAGRMLRLYDLDMPGADHYAAIVSEVYAGVGDSE